MHANKKENGIYKKIEVLIIWVAYLKGNTMPRAENGKIKVIIGWLDSAIKKLVASQTLAKMVKDVLNKYFC